VPRARSSRCAALALLIASLFARGAAAQGLAGGTADMHEPVSSAPVPGETAVVVLIGTAGGDGELVSVLSELMLRQGVQPQLLSEPRFSPRALLDAGNDDARVWVFVAPKGPERARLYFRGPFGARFMLRELSLRGGRAGHPGFDEVDRELIARVVESATVALLHSQEGLSREQAAADLARSERAQEEPTPSAATPRVSFRNGAPTAVPPDRDEAARMRSPAERAWLLGARVLGQWTGADLGARLGLGLELGWLAPSDAPLRVRARLALEPSLPQAIDSDAVDATVMSWPLRLGVDLGTRSGASGYWLGASAGADLVRVAPERAHAAELTTTDPELYAAFAARAELRYELALAALQLSAGVLLDVAFARSHYDVIATGSRTRVASPWIARPGLALGCATAF